jgi:cell division protein ZapA
VTRVTILGSDYVVRSDASAVDIQQVADFVNERIEDVLASGRGADTLGAVVLTLLNVAGEHLRLRESGGVVAMEQRLEHLLARVEDALPGKLR